MLANNNATIIEIWALHFFKRLYFRCLVIVGEQHEVSEDHLHPRLVLHLYLFELLGNPLRAVHHSVELVHVDVSPCLRIKERYLLPVPEILVRVPRERVLAVPDLILDYLVQ